MVDDCEFVVARSTETGKTVAWVDGEFGGDPGLVTKCQIMRKAGPSVQTPDGTWLKADADDLEAVIAVMLDACGGEAEFFGSVPQSLMQRSA